MMNALAELRRSFMRATLRARGQPVLNDSATALAQAARRGARQADALPREVRLVGVPGERREVGEPVARASLGEPQEPAEADDPLQRLRAVAQRGDAAAAELALAQSDDLGDRAARRRAQPDDGVDCRIDRGGA